MERGQVEGRRKGVFLIMKRIDGQYWLRRISGWFGGRVEGGVDGRTELDWGMFFLFLLFSVWAIVGRWSAGIRWWWFGEVGGGEGRLGGGMM